METTNITRNLGGDRLGSGSKNNITLHKYNRSTHDLSRAWRSSMNVGTLVPCFVEPALPGDTWSIDIAALARTIPTIGPLFGSYKLQIDFFECPIRLYNGLLHNNMTKIGLNISQVKLPKLAIEHTIKNPDKYAVNKKTQFATDSLLHYLGLSGIGTADFDNAKTQQYLLRKFNAVPVLAYYDIYKNYYANKQEEKGLVITANPIEENIIATKITQYPSYAPAYNVEREIYYNKPLPENVTLQYDTYGEFQYPIYYQPERATDELTLTVNGEMPTAGGLFEYVVQYDDETYGVIDGDDWLIGGTGTNETGTKIKLGTIDWEYLETHNIVKVIGIAYDTESQWTSNIKLEPFELENIDNMRILILQNTGLNNELVIGQTEGAGIMPYKTLIDSTDSTETYNKFSQNGLAIKTYQSDLFNNWLQTEWIDGENGINNITAIDVSSGSFTIDALNLANKVYNMLNRIAVSGGSYEDYIEAVYTVETMRRAESPVYKGGMSTEIVFEEVVSTAATEESTLGQIAGRGVTTNHRGGKIEIKCDEPSFIIGIVSITPRLDYSQGNKWFMTELDTLDDLHKPALDGIGFEDLLEERMAWFGTKWNDDDQVWIKRAMGKVPAWINYMTSVNECHGDFAEQDKTMWMTLNRNYDMAISREGLALGIEDKTTYIDPTKYNYTFADTKLAAQNFWVQIGFQAIARRVMSAKVIPNL